MSVTCLRPSSMSENGGEQEVAILGGEVAARRAEGGVHGHRPWQLQAGGPAHHALERIVFALEVERLVGAIAALDDVDPFGGLAIGVLANLGAEHGELLRIPAADDVEPGAAAADVIDGGQRLGGIDRMHDRHVHRHEQADLLRHRGEARGPGKGLERPLAHVILAAEAAPARDRQKEFEPRAVGDTGRVQIVVPTGAPALGDIGDGEAAVALAENTPSLKRFGPLRGCGAIQSVPCAMDGVVAKPLASKKNTVFCLSPMAIKSLARCAKAKRFMARRLHCPDHGALRPDVGSSVQATSSVSPSCSINIERSPP